MTKPHSPRFWIAVAVATTLGLGACGNSDAGGADQKPPLYRRPLITT